MITAEKKILAQKLIQTGTAVVRLKTQQRLSVYQRQLAEKIYKKQADDFESNFMAAVNPLFKAQIESAIKKLKGLSQVPSTSAQIFNSSDWNKELKNRALPPIAKAMAEAAMAQYIQIKNQVKIKKAFDGLKCGGPGSGVPGPCPMPKHDEHVRQSIELAGNEIRSAAKGKMQEFGILLDKSGKPLGPMVHGGEDTVNDYPSQHLFDVKGSDLSLIHNHPMREGRSLTELSPGDLYTLGKPGMKHMVVVHPHENDTMTIATRNKDVDQSTWFNAVTSSYRIANDYTHQSKEGKRIAEDNDFAFLDTHRVAIKILENLGYIELISNSGGATKKHLDQYGSVYDKWAKAGAEDFKHTKSFKSTKASTATQWLDSLSEEDKKPLNNAVFETPYGNVSLAFATEYPDWMKQSIQNRLQETFAEPYWDDINSTTGGDIDSLLGEGLRDGWSIDEMASEMEDRYGTDAYPKSRGLRIARTESGNALNAARSDVIDRLKAELGDQYPMRKVWLSVLGNTTRDDHAHLDGVPAASDGCWALGGIRCRWPGDVKLPAKQRIHCQCSIMTQFGLQDADADELIAEHEIRQAAEGKSVIFSRLKCGGPGSGVPGPCPQPKHDEHGKIIPGSVGHTLGMNTHNAHILFSASHQQGLEEVSTIEKMLHVGDHADIFSAQPSTALGKIAKQSALDLINKQNQSLPTGAVPTKADPNIASPAGWVKIGPQLGTEKGGTYELSGEKYYVKTPDDSDRAKNEVLALKLYTAAGGSAVNGNLVQIEGKPAVATKWIENSEKVDWGNAGSKVKAAGDFAIHVWLNNRDAVGAGSEKPEDNIRLNKDTGKLTLVDAGGSLLYKGMGGSGKKPLNPNAIEWDTFRDASVNPTMAKVFGGMTPQQLIDSANKLKGMTDAKIGHLVGQHGPGNTVDHANLVKALIARRNYILDISKKLEAQIAASVAPAITPTPPTTQHLNTTHKAVAPALPPPPNVIAGKSGKQMEVWQDYQNKYNAIYAAAKAGDQKALDAVKTNPDAKSPYPKALADYKKQAQAAMQAGGKASPDHVVAQTPLSAPLPPKPGQSNPPGTPSLVVKPSTPVSAFTNPAPVPPSIKIDPNQFPSNPVFKSTLAHQVQQNNDKVQEALDLAKKGDLIGLQGMKLTGSPKLSQWHQELVGNLSKQLNPPPPKVQPATLAGGYGALSAHISSDPKSQSGKDKLGYWVVLGQVQNVPSGIQPGTWQTSGSPKLWDAGNNSFEKAIGAKTALRDYTGQDYSNMNDALRHGVTKGAYNETHQQSMYDKALLASKAIMEHGHDIEPGLMLSRNHSGVSGTDWSNISPGSVISDKAVLSTSVLEKGVFSGSGTALRLTVGTGVKGIAVKSFSKNPAENEVVLPPNQRIMITHVDVGKHITTVHGVVLPTLDTQCCPP